VRDFFAERSSPHVACGKATAVSYDCNAKGCGEMISYYAAVRSRRTGPFSDGASTFTITSAARRQSWKFYHA
jgi:hypothetical protein